MGYLVGKDEFKVLKIVYLVTYLGRRLVAYEKPVFYFNSADHVFLHFDRGLHLLLGWLLGALYKRTEVCHWLPYLDIKNMLCFGFAFYFINDG